MLRTFVFAIAGLCVAAVFQRMPASQPAPNIICQGSTRYAAFVYASGLNGPDGLAINKAGVVYVAEETRGRVVRLDEQGNKTTVMIGLRNPEGVAFGPDDTLYVVEDVQNGRLLARSPNGTETTLAENLIWPEGVVWSDNKLYVTESNIEHPGVVDNPFLLETYLTKITQQNKTRTKAPLGRSYSGIVAAPNHTLYVANELAGASYNGFTLRESVYRGNANAQQVFAQGLTSAEGLRFAPAGFPLYVAEESLGQISAVASDGTSSILCTGFGGVEDIVVDQAGRIFVSDDEQGQVVVLLPQIAPAPSPTATTPPKARRVFLPWTVSPSFAR